MKAKLPALGILLLVAVIAILALWRYVAPQVAYPILMLLGSTAVIVWTLVAYQAILGTRAATRPVGAGGSERIVLKDGAEYRVAIDEGSIVLTHIPKGTSETVYWSNITGVLVVAADERPLGGISFMLEHDGETLEVPLGATGNEALLGELQDRLPGFDNEALIEAMAMAHGFKRVWPAEPATEAARA